MEPRTSAGIALGPDPDQPSNYLFMSLTSGRKISRHQYRPLPTTEAVIAQVHAFALGDNVQNDPPAADPFLFE